MITEQLAVFISEQPVSMIPKATQRMLQLSMLDWAACGIAGASEPVSRITRDMVASEGGSAQAGVFGSQIRMPARAAALVNGTTSHALDYDDTHFAHIGHPSVVVMSAALALAEAEHVSGEELQTAALIGIETSIRIGVWLGRDHYQTGFHQTGTAGAFGAAAASARLLGFDPAQTAATLGLVATRASGLKSQFGTMGKPYNAGLAASNGVEAALLVRQGFQPNPLGLESPQGFGATHAGQFNETALKDLGYSWYLDDISHKFHACCHGLHATLEALGAMNRPSAEDIKKIEILTHPRWMTVCNQSGPTTGLGAKFSYGMVTAMRLLGHSTAALESYSDVLCLNPDVISMRDKVEVKANDQLSETQAVLEITLNDGSTLNARHDLNTPISLTDRDSRLKSKAMALVGVARTDALEKLIIRKAPPSEFGIALSS